VYFVNKKKLHPFLYIRVFISASVAVLLLGGVSELFGWPSDTFHATIEYFWFVPVSLVLFLFFFHLTKGFLARTYDESEEQQAFIMHMSKKVRRRLNLEKDDFLRLQDDDKFQRFFHDTFVIFREGETEERNFDKLEERFDDDYPHKDVVKYVIREARRLRRKYKD